MAMDNARPAEIEPFSNRHGFHRLAVAMLPWAIRRDIHPNSVTMAGLGFGLLAALAYMQWTDWRFATMGLLFMLLWHVMDGLDGRLARATGKNSDFGRLLDGIADYSTFVAVYLALAISHATPWPALGLALVAGLAHALQSQFYEGERATYIRRTAGEFEPRLRPAAGGWAERLYNRGEAMLGNRARALDAQLMAAGPEEQARLLAAWRPRAERTLRLMEPLSANGRTFAIWLAVMAGEPMLYWVWEIAGLTLLALAAARSLRQAENVPPASAAPANGGQ
ncbi:MAG: CDP-alcohol phosphatidyltransferase family protein [Sandarakinorhabdus sp.]|nr:CDP-alcohol phosphatidyltransferase family protein [Sandarakinorhabdus sp.]